MIKTIELTEEQYAALQAGNSITIEPPKLNQWEPKSGGYWINSEGTPVEYPSSKEARIFGVERKTKEEAEKAATAMRIHNRLLAYVAEFDKGWEADWDNKDQYKHCVFYNESTHKFVGIASYISRGIGTVYMSEQCADELCDKLNSGEVVL